MLGKKSKLTLKLVMMVVATSTMMTTLSSMVQIGYEYKQEKSQLDSNLLAIEKTGIESLKGLVWTVDYTSIDRQIDSILLIPEVVKIRVLEENGTVIAEKSKTESQFERVKHIEFKFTQGDSTNFGKADLYYTTDYLIEHLRRRIITILITNFIKTFLASAVLMFLFSYVVVNPITMLAQSFDRSVFNDLSQMRRVTLAKRGQRDEIDELCEGVNEAFGLIEKSTRENRQLIADQQTEIVVQSTHTIEAIKKVDEVEERLRTEQVASAEAKKIAMVGILAQGMAHEVNNPLTIIKGQVWHLQEILKQEESRVDDFIKIDRHKFQSRIVSIEKAISRIINIIASLKKLGAAGDSSETKIIAVQDLFEDVKNLMTSVCAQHQVTLSVDPGSAPNVFIKVRESSMVQVLVNLINNSLEAVESLPDSEKWIRLTAETHVRGDGGGTYLKVTDCGSGIPSEIAEKVFLPFFTTKSVGKGTGLGLSVVHQLVADQGGQIYVNPEASNTEFVIKLPKAA